MSLNEENRRLIVDIEIMKSREAFADLEMLVEGNRWNGAANRLYYAVFHAANALLIHEGQTIKSHKGSMIMFNKLYILTEKLLATFGILYSQLETLREESDYTLLYNVDPDKLKNYINPAKEMIDTIAEMVKNN